MANETVPTPLVPVAAAPVAAPAAPAPVAQTPAAPVAVPAAAPPADTAKSPTVLGAEPVKAPEIVKDAPVVAESAPAPQKEEAALSAEPAPLPTYDAFVLPEGVAFDTAKLGEFTGMLAEIEQAKGDHAKMQATGQKLLDKYVSEIKGALTMQEEMRVAAEEKRATDWHDAFMKDPEIGGARWETSRNAAQEFIRTHGGNEAQQKEFRDLMNQTKIGNHPAMIRILAKAMTAMHEGRPLPAQTPESRPMSKIEKRYGKIS